MQEKKKRTQSAGNTSPLPPLSGTIHGQAPSSLQGARLCVCQSTFGTEEPPAHAGAECLSIAEQKGFGAIYCQARLTAVPAERGRQSPGRLELSCAEGVCGPPGEPGAIRQCILKWNTCFFLLFQVVANVCESVCEPQRGKL